MRAGAFLFQPVHIDQRAGGGHIPAVEERVHAHSLDALPLGALDERDEVGDVAVHIAVGQQPDEMHGRRVFKAVVRKSAPGGGREYVAALYRLFDEFRALRVDLPATERVVPDFAVAHILVGGQPHRGAVRLDIGVRTLGEQLVESGGVRLADGVPEPRL